MNLADLQKAMANEPQADCPVTHYFSDGIYARELFIPKGVCIVGAEHKTKHLFMVIEGECFISNNGKKAAKVTAPYIGETLPGTQRAITATKDTKLITFHVTDETDVSKIGDEILKPSISLLPQWKRKALEVAK